MYTESIVMKEFSRLDSKVKRISRYLTRDKELQKDLCQEMRVHLWQVEEGHTDSFYLQGAKYVALKYMRDCIGKEVSVGTLNDLEKFMYHADNADSTFYDSWHTVDKSTEKFKTGETV